MSLPSNAGGRTTTTVGFFAASALRLAAWLLDDLGPGWRLASPGWASATDAFAALKPMVPRSRYAWIPIGDWTVLLSNGPLGTDVGLLPMHAVRAFGGRAIRAVSVDDSELHPARILEVYDEHSTDPLNMERSIAAANDGGRWVFETSGTPYPFEDQTAYTRRLKRDRFTTDMLYDYLRALGVPFDQDPRWAGAMTVQRASPTPRTAPPPVR